MDSQASALDTHTDFRPNRALSGLITLAPLLRNNSPFHCALGSLYRFAGDNRWRSRRHTIGRTLTGEDQVWAPARTGGRARLACRTLDGSRTRRRSYVGPLDEDDYVGRTSLVFGCERSILLGELCEFVALRRLFELS